MNRFLQSQPSGVVLLSAWMEQQGYGDDLQKQARDNGLMESIGPGALVRTGDQVDCLGAVHTLQTQTGSTVHPGGSPDWDGPCVCPVLPWFQGESMIRTMYFLVGYSIDYGPAGPLLQQPRLQYWCMVLCNNHGGHFSHLVGVNGRACAQDSAPILSQTTKRQGIVNNNSVIVNQAPVSVNTNLPAG